MIYMAWVDVIDENVCTPFALLQVLFPFIQLFHFFLSFLTDLIGEGIIFFSSFSTLSSLEGSYLVKRGE
jgi:hypothetical protein